MNDDLGAMMLENKLISLFIIHYSFLLLQHGTGN
jgi:hypothetical protein